MAKQAVAHAADVEPIDRLEEKVKLLIGMITTLRTEQTRAADENARLIQEIDNLRARLADAEGTNEELALLRGERDDVRSRVAELLQQLEAL
jgi:regulator of replication initiation timing